MEILYISLAQFRVLFYTVYTPRGWSEERGMNMSEERKQALRYLKTVRGQMDGIIKMIEEERYCIDISNQILASGALLKKANLHILTGHMETCVKQAIQDEDALDEKLSEIETLFAKMIK